MLYNPRMAHFLRPRVDVNPQLAKRDPHVIPNRQASNARRKSRSHSLTRSTIFGVISSIFWGFVSKVIAVRRTGATLNSSREYH